MIGANSHSEDAVAGAVTEVLGDPEGDDQIQMTMLTIGMKNRISHQPGLPGDLASCR